MNALTKLTPMTHELGGVGKSGGKVSVPDHRSRIERIHTIITDLHNCDSFHVATVPVHWRLPGRQVWDGLVEVFDLIGHPQAPRCYAGTQANGKRGGGERVWTVLALPPVISPEAAVQAFLARANPPENP